MKRGPAPQPTVLKKLKGNPGKRPLPKKEPMPEKPDRIPPAPRHLDNAGKKEWRRITKELYPIGLVSKIDLVALSAYCACYSTWVTAQGMIQKHGVLIKAQSGFPMQSPYLQISNKAMTEMRKWLIEFGMTPSSRSRVEISKPTEADPMEDFLKKGGKPYEVKKGGKE